MNEISGMKIRLIYLFAAIAAAVIAAEGIRHPEDDPTLISLNNKQALILDAWVPPVHPPELRSIAAETVVRVRFEVDENGAIMSPRVLSGDGRFHAAALAAIRQWKYRAVGNGAKPDRLSYDVAFPFHPDRQPKPASRFAVPYAIEPSPLNPAQPRETPDPTFPKHLVPRQFFGEVELILGINKEGRVDGVEVLHSTHPDLLAAGFAAVEKWLFEPAARGAVPTRGEKRAVLKFVVVDKETDHVVRNDWMEKNGIALRETGAPRPWDFFDEVPKAEAFVDPVYPEDLLRNGTEGAAQVDFSVDREGMTTAIKVVEASEEAFGFALAAAVTAWKFEPLFRDGKETWADFTVRWNFSKPTARNTAPEMLFALEHPGNRVNPKQLDRPLKPLFQRSVAGAAAGPADSAEIEVTINQAGRVCWPGIRKASSPAYGWAAATAVSQWYFETPRKGGQPVDVHVIIPVQQGTN